FAALPAGWYNDPLNRYQDLYGFAGWWASNTPAGTNAYYFYLTYYCDELRSDLTNKTNAMSVRCVME
ncbi:MAG: fibrobacter succinogenes major paralogous domain-containing protein, partial [Lentimicrobiaceae bacterium]|nr:fibrobacter succinogenes major paralogous domain-containing protein [Lentimicrobiaceae bacterium]